MKPNIKYYLGLLWLLSDKYKIKNVSDLKNVKDNYPPERFEIVLFNEFITLFPYLSIEDSGKRIFDEMLSRAEENLKCGITPKSFIKYLRENYFQDQIESINSSQLFHFIPPEYFLKTLKGKFLYPTHANIWEYDFSPFRKYHQDIKFQYSFDDLKSLFKSSKSFVEKVQAEGRPKKDDFKSLKAPIFNCLTDMHIKDIPFHASHYGCFGIGFKKENCFKKYNSTELTQLKPVHYEPMTSSIKYQTLIEQALFNKDLTSLHKNALLVEILNSKVISDEGFLPSNYFSALYEKEWRFVSLEKVFEFEYSDIEYITIKEESYLRHFDRKGGTLAPVKFITDIINFCEKNSIKIIPVKQSYNTLGQELSLMEDRRVDRILLKQN